MELVLKPRPGGAVWACGPVVTVLQCVLLVGV